MSKPQIIFLPGLLCDDAFFKSQINFLSQRFDSIIADYGYADSLSEMAQIALNNANQKYIIIGHSMGGRVALEIMRNHSQNVEKLVLLNTGIHPLKEGEIANRQILIDLAFNEGMEALANKWLFPMIAPERIGDEKLFDEMRKMVMRKNPQIHENQIKALIYRPNVEAVLAAINCPTLVVTGRDDNWSPPAQHQEIAHKIKNSELKLIDNCGHMSCMEQPVAMNGLLNDWL